MRHEAPLFCLAFSLAALAGGCEPSDISPGATQNVDAPGPSGSSIPSARAQRLPPATPALPAASHPYTGGSWATCAAGFTTTGEVEKDLTRLSYLCGPYHGMQRYPKRWSDQVGPTRPGAVPDLPLQRGDCIRVFAVADRKNATFTVTVLVRDVTVGRVASQDGYAVANASGAICAPLGGTTKIAIRSDAQPSRVAAEVWILR